MNKRIKLLLLCLIVISGCTVSPGYHGGYATKHRHSKYPGNYHNYNK